MSCMEHLCIGCGYIILDNEPKQTIKCPNCGGDRWASICDEIPMVKDEEE